MPLPLLAGAAIQAIPGLIGGISQLFGKKRRQQEEDKASGGISQLADVFKSQLGQDYFDSEEAQGAMRQIKDNQSDQNEQINASANVNGMTDEARIAMMGNNMKASQGAFADLSRSASLWRQRNQQLYSGQLNQLYQVGMNNRANKTQSLSNILGPLQGAIDGAANVGVFDGMGSGSAGSAMGNPAAGLMGNRQVGMDYKNVKF